MKLVYNGKSFVLAKDKLIYFLSKLENRNLDKISEPEIYKLIKKYKLLDEVFLAEISEQAKKE